MLSDGERQTLSDLERQLLLEDPLLVRQFRTATVPGAPMKGGSSATVEERPPRQRHLLLAALTVAIAAPFVAYVAVPGVLNAVVALSFTVLAVAWAWFWSDLAR